MLTYGTTHEGLYFCQYKKVKSSNSRSWFDSLEYLFTDDSGHRFYKDGKWYILIYITNLEDEYEDVFQNYEQHKENYDDRYRCQFCGEELIKVKEHYEAYGSEFSIPVWICPNCG